MSIVGRAACRAQRAAVRCHTAAAPLSRILVLVAVVAVFTSCDFGIFGGPSGPGLFDVTLTSPYGPDGAAVLELTGGVGLGVVAVDLGQSFYEHDGSTTRAVVVLAVPGPIHFTVRAEDIGKIPTVTLVQVAGADNELRQDLSAYDVSVERIEDITSKSVVGTP